MKYSYFHALMGILKQSAYNRKSRHLTSIQKQSLQQCNHGNTSNRYIYSKCSLKRGMDPFNNYTPSMSSI